VYDFILFKSFISEYVLIIFYWLGVIGMPIFAYIIYKNKKFNTVIKRVFNIAKSSYDSLGLKYRIYIALFIFFSLIFMEIIWRLMFEFLIAFMQMHRVLVGI